MESTDSMGDHCRSEACALDFVFPLWYNSSLFGLDKKALYGALFLS